MKSAIMTYKLRDAYMTFIKKYTYEILLTSSLFVLLSGVYYSLTNAFS